MSDYSKLSKEECLKALAEMESVIKGMSKTGNVKAVKEFVIEAIISSRGLTKDEIQDKIKLVFGERLTDQKFIELLNSIRRGFKKQDGLVLIKTARSKAGKYKVYKMEEYIR